MKLLTQGTSDSCSLWSITNPAWDLARFTRENDMAFFHIVPDGWAFPELFQHRVEGERKENGIFFHFPSFCNFSVITKSHIVANFPASILTYISQGDRGPLALLILPAIGQELSKLTTYQFPALRISQVSRVPGFPEGRRERKVD